MKKEKKKKTYKEKEDDKEMKRKERIRKIRERKKKIKRKRKREKINTWKKLKNTREDWKFEKIIHKENVNKKRNKCGYKSKIKGKKMKN